MASTSITTVGGVVVVTQVIPKDDHSIPLQGSQDPPLDPPPARSSPAPAKVDDMTAMFLRGAPLELGAVQIMIGLLGAPFSLIAISSWNTIVMVPFALSLVFVCSGSIAVIAGKRRTVPWVWVSLLSHLLSAVVALLGVVYVCWLLVFVQPYNLICDKDDFVKFPNPDRLLEKCRDSLYLLTNVIYGIWGLLLVLLVLQFCVSISVSVFSGKALKLRHRYRPVNQGEREDCNTLLPASP